MSFRELVIGGPRNVRKNLFRDIIVIILITLCSVLALAFYRGLSIKDQISSKIINESSQLIQERFITFLSPFELSLRYLSRASELKNFDFDLTQKQKIEDIFIPFLDVYGDLGKISIVADSGEFVSLIRKKTGYETTTNQDDRDVSPYSSKVYQGAASAPAENPVFWSESFTSAHDKSGISASIKIKRAHQGQSVVIIFFIPASKILTFISDIEVPDNVDIILYSKQGIFLSKNQLDFFGDQAGKLGKNPVPAPYSDEISQALELWATKNSPGQTVAKFSSSGMSWWAGFSPLGSSDVEAWISVIVPESEITRDVYQHWYNLAIPIGLILFFAIVMTFNLVRRYSFQLKDLPQQQIVSTDFSDSIRRLINGGESSTLEFKSTIRKNLNSGKFGKEIEIAWLKSVTAFMNSDGGILLIGVNDDGEICGIAKDEFSNEDKCQLHFKNLINAHIGPGFTRYIHLKFCHFGDKTILVIECERVRKPVFLSIGKTEDFYIRSGPSSMKLTMSSMVSYLSER
jgi:hypothetical protein